MYSKKTEKHGVPLCAFRKILRIMRLTTVILIATLMQVNAAGFAQKINLSRSKASLKSVLAELQKKSSFIFLYSDDVLKQAKPVDIEAKQEDFNIVLQKVFAQQTLTYTVTNNVITIKAYKPGFLDRMKELLMVNLDVRGRVLDSLGAPLQGASVRVRSTGKMVNTDSRGEFNLPGLVENEQLEISYIGYIQQTVKVGTELMVIRLLPSTAKLDEVMVIGYGTTTRRLSTGSTGKVSGDEITRQPVSNPILAMEGRVPGLFITQSAGYAGANVSVVIRGQNSFTFNSASPLYVVDGVPFFSNPIEQSVGGFSAGIGFSPLNTINPADIESIDVLKDADATAIYGSRGANGVILITTKKGRPGNTQFTVDFSSGAGKVSNTIPMLSTAEYLQVRREAFANDNVIPTPQNAPDLTLWDQQANTNFPDLLIGNTSRQTNASFSLSGGDAYTQFLFGGNYRKETIVYRSNTSDKAVQFRLSAQHRSKNNKFGSDVSVSYNLDNNTIPGYNLNVTNYSLPSNYPLYNPDGTLYFGPGYDNPLAAFNATKNLKSANLNTNASLRYTIIPGLDAKVNGGFNQINVEGTNITPASASNPAYNYTPTIMFNNNYVRTYIAEPQLNYKLNTGKGRLNALLGGTWQKTETVQPYWMLAFYSNQQLVKSLGALNVIAKSSDYIDYRYTSGFGRVEYTWDNKYLFSANIRRDGSSRFGSNNRFGTFGSAALAWIFSKERFVADLIPSLSHGKLRASYGTIGNDKIQDYSYQSNYGNGGSYGTYTTLVPQRIANPYLQWEITKKLDIAAEFGFWNDRMLFTAAYYRNRSSNLLGDIPLPGQTGFPQYSSNIDAVVQNRGAEFELTTVNVQHKTLRWSTSFNLTIPENKLLSFKDLENSSYANTYVVGKSLNLRSAFQSTGIVDGIATVADLNSDGVITFGLNDNGNGDFLISGNNDPKLYGGLSNTLTYKGFQLDVFFQGVKRTAVRGDLNFSSYPGLGYNLPKTMLDVGLKYSANYGTPATDAQIYYTASDAAIEDASFIRLKNVSLAYQVPASFSKKFGMTTLQLYARGQNLLTITNYKGLDPETLSTQVPTLKMFIAGIRTTF